MKLKAYFILAALWITPWLTLSAFAQRAEEVRPAAAQINQEDIDWEKNKPLPTSVEIFGLPTNWHAQTTYINQRYPNFNAQYSGPNSLNKNHSMAYTWSGTLYLGARVAPNTDFYYNPEVVSGVPFSNLTGLGGVANGESNKAVGSQARFYSARTFVRHTINQEGEKLYLEDEANQIAQTVSSNRVVITGGQFALLDIFDYSSYAKDPRTQFLNWGNLTYLAYDYAADSRGYGWGLAGEWYLDNWALRAARMTAPKTPNSLGLDFNILKHYGDQIEVERNHQINQLPGKVSVLAFRNRMILSTYSNATNYIYQNNAQGTQAINNTRYSEQYKMGAGINAEQALGKDFGVFMRVFQNDGKAETMAFAEADNSISIGMGINGNSWSRPKDVVGVSVMRNGLSSSHQQYLQAGGLTFFIGDYAGPGKSISYRPEQINEIYYNATLVRGVLAGINYQRINNPAFNSARGPVNIYSFRIHAEY